MLNKTTTLVLLASLTATQGMWASDAKEDLSSSNSSSARTSSSALLIETNELLLLPSSISEDAFVDLDAIDLEGLSKPTDFYATLKDLDQHGSKYAGEKVKALFDEKVPGGKTITWIAGMVAKQAFGTATLTEGLLKIARKPLEIKAEKYPETVPGIIGYKVKNIINLIPGGDKVTAVAGKAGKTFFGTETLTEGIIEKLTSKSDSSKSIPKENPKASSSTSDITTESTEFETK